MANASERDEDEWNMILWFCVSASRRIKKGAFDDDNSAMRSLSSGVDENYQLMDRHYR